MIKILMLSPKEHLNNAVKTKVRKLRLSSSKMLTRKLVLKKQYRKVSNNNLSSKACGHLKKTCCCSSSLSRVELKTGPPLLNTWAAEGQSSAASTGTISWTLALKKANGVRKRSGSCSWLTNFMATNGSIYRSSSKDAAITRSKTNGTQSWSARSHHGESSRRLSRNVSTNMVG